MLTRLQQTGADMARSSSRRTDAELCLITLCDPTLDDTPAGLNARLSRLEQGGVIAAPAAPATAKFCQAGAVHGRSASLGGSRSADKAAGAQPCRP